MGAVMGTAIDPYRESRFGEIMMKSRYILSAIIALLTCWLTAAQLAAQYRWVDQQGTVHYSQFPPPTTGPDAPKGSAERSQSQPGDKATTPSRERNGGSAATPPEPKRKAAQPSAADTDTQQNAIALAKIGRGEEAAAMLERLLLRTSDPREIIGLRVLLGDLYSSQVKLGEAVKQYDHALALDSRLAAVHFRRGAVLWRIPGRGEAAVAALKKSRELGYDDPEFFYLFGASYKSMAEDRDTPAAKRKEYLNLAAEHFKKGLERDPSNLALLGNLADIYFNTGRYDEALAWYKRAAGVAPGNPLVMGRMADTYLRMGKPREAVDLLQHALTAHERQAEPTDVEGGLVRLAAEINMRYYLAQGWSALGRRADAQRELGKVVELSNRTVQGYRVGGVAAEQGRRAREILKGK